MRTKEDESRIRELREHVEQGKLTFIGLGGRAQSGKSTLARCLAERLSEEDHLAVVVPLTLSLRNTARIFFATPAGEKVPREALLYLGDVLRHYDPWGICRAWLGCVYQSVQRMGIPRMMPADLGGRKMVVIVDDLRLPDECELLRELGTDPYFVDSGEGLVIDHPTEALANMVPNSPARLTAFPGGDVKVDHDLGEKVLRDMVVPSVLGPLGLLEAEKL